MRSNMMHWTSQDAQGQEATRQCRTRQAGLPCIMMLRQRAGLSHLGIDELIDGRDARQPVVVIRTVHISETQLAIWPTRRTTQQGSPVRSLLHQAMDLSLDVLQTASPCLRAVPARGACCASAPVHTHMRHA